VACKAKRKTTKQKTACRELVNAIFKASQQTGLSHTEVCMSLLVACNPDYNVNLKLTRKRKGAK